MAALVLGGCGSSTPSTAPTTPPLGVDFYTIGVKVFNNSPSCAWITPYWTSGSALPWHIFDKPVNPRFVEAGKSFNFSYLIIPKIPFKSTVGIKVLAEVQHGPGCSGGNTGVSPYRENYDLSPQEGILEACARLEHVNGTYVVTLPSQVGPDPRLTDCPNK